MINPEFLRRNFESLLREHGPKVYTQAVRLSGNEADGQDLARDTFLRAYKTLSRLGEDSSMETWLSGICADLWDKRSNPGKSWFFWRRTAPIPAMAEAPIADAPVAETPAAEVPADSAPEGAVKEIQEDKPEPPPTAENTPEPLTPPEGFYLGVLNHTSSPQSTARSWGMPALALACSFLVVLGAGLIWKTRKKAIQAPVPHSIPPGVKSAANPKKPQTDSIADLQRLIASAPMISTATPHADTVTPVQAVPVARAKNAPAKAPTPAPKAVARIATVKKIPLPTPVPAAPSLDSAPEADAVSTETVSAAIAGTPANSFPDWRGTTCGITDPITIIIQSPEQWQTLWRAHFRTAGSQLPVPDIDFNRYIVVGIYIGQKPSAGYEVEIVNTQETGGVLVVSYRETIPTESDQDSMATQPYHLKAIPKSTLPIQFKSL